MAESVKPVELDDVGLDRAAGLLQHVSTSVADAVLSRLDDSVAQAIRLRVANTSVLPAAKAEPFAFLSDVAESDLIAAIRQERSQTIAVLLSAMPVEYAPRIMAALALDQRMEIIKTIAELRAVDADLVGDLAAGLRQRVTLARATAGAAGQGVQHVARILAACDRPTEWSLLRTLGKRSPQLTERVQEMLFDFEDIAHLPDAEVQSLAKNVGTESWAAALQRCSANVRNKVIKNLSPRAAQHLRAEMNYLGEVMPSEIDRGQQRVIDVARQLAETNQIRRAA